MYDDIPILLVKSIENSNVYYVLTPGNTIIRLHYWKYSYVCLKDITWGQVLITLFPSKAIHQRILLYNNLVIAQAITKLLYNKVLYSKVLYNKVLTKLLFSKVLKAA